MAGKLDQSLDEILSTRRTAGRGRGRAGRRTVNGRTAPAGGIQKNTAKTATKVAGKSTGTVPAGGDSKIIVSNLPPDVTESQIKEYFGKSVGAVKKATITYGPNGISRGIATIIFLKPGTASEAAVKLNGLLVDKRPMKVEVVLDASRASTIEPAKGISDRITKAKAQPKQAAATKATDGAARGRGGRVKRGRNAGRPKAKTADELDAEMTDYFGATNGTDAGAATTNGAAAAAAGGDDLGMDEVSIDVLKSGQRKD